MELEDIGGIIKSLGHLPSLTTIDKDARGYAEMAKVTWSQKGQDNVQEKLLFIEGIEPNGIMTKENCPTLVASAGVEYESHFFGLLGETLRKKLVLIPINDLRSYRPLNFK